MEAKATNIEEARANKGRLRTLRAELVRDDDNVERFIRFEARCTKKFGPAAGMFIRQLVFWSDKGADPNGWIYKSRAEFEDEVGLSQRQQENARKVLKAAGVLEEEIRLAAPSYNYRVMHYRVDLEKLMGVLEDPNSTLNQWKRGRRYAKNTSGQFERLAENVSLDNTESDHPLGNSESEVQHGSTESDHPLDNTESDVSLGISDSDHPLGNSESATESTSENSSDSSSDSSSESSSKEFSFQEGANGFSSRPTPASINNKSPKTQEHHEGVNGSRQASFSGEPNLDAELLSQVKEVLQDEPWPDNAAGMFEAYRDIPRLDDEVYIMQAVASELGRYLSEDLRHHVKTAMLELQLDRR